MQAEAREAPVSGPFLGGVRFHARGIAKGRPEIGLPRGQAPQFHGGFLGVTKFRPKESVIRLSIMGAPEPDAHLRQILGAGLHHHIPRLHKALGGGLEIRIGLNGLRHQLVQHRIAIQGPPIGAQFVIRRGRLHEGTRPVPRRRHDVLRRFIGRRQVSPWKPLAARRQGQHQNQ